MINITKHLNLNYVMIILYSISIKWMICINSDVNFKKCLDLSSNNSIFVFRYYNTFFMFIFLKQEICICSF